MTKEGERLPRKSSKPGHRCVIWCVSTACVSAQCAAAGAASSALTKAAPRPIAEVGPWPEMSSRSLTTCGNSGHDTCTAAPASRSAVSACTQHARSRAINLPAGSFEQPCLDIPYCGLNDVWEQRPRRLRHLPRPAWSPPGPCTQETGVPMFCNVLAVSKGSFPFPI